MNFDALTPGQLLPNWELETIFGNKIPSIEDYRGKPLLILFFNIICAGCKHRAIPFANRLVYEDRGVNAIGIHTRFEGPKHTDEELQALKEEYFVRFPYYRDYKNATTYFKYKAGGTPHWILTDSYGKVVQSIFGSDPNNALLNLDLKIEELTGNPPGGPNN